MRIPVELEEEWIEITQFGSAERLFLPASGKGDPIVWWCDWEWDG